MAVNLSGIPGMPTASGAYAQDSTEGTGASGDAKGVGRGQGGDNREFIHLPRPGRESPPIGRRFGGDEGPSTKDLEAQEKKLTEAFDKIRNDPALRDKLMSILSNPTTGAEEIAALLIKLSNMNRENVLDQRLQARSAARSDLEGAAGEMREAAAKQIAGAIVSAVMSVAAAVVTGVMSGMSISKSAKGIDSSQKAAGLQKDASIAKNAGQADAPDLKAEYKIESARGEKLGLDARNLSDRGNAISKALSGAGELISGSLQGSGRLDDATAKEKEASATDQQAQGDVAKKALDDLEEMVKSAIQFLKAMQAAEADLMANMTRV